MLMPMVSTWTWAYTPETVPNPRDLDARSFVANPDMLITAEHVDSLQKIARRIYASTEVEVCFVAIGSTDYADAADFSVRLFNRWGIGSAKQNTGVLVFLALDTRDIRITTGAGIEGILTDYRCSVIIDDALAPLSEGKYGEG